MQIFVERIQVNGNIWENGRHDCRLIPKRGLRRKSVAVHLDIRGRHDVRNCVSCILVARLDGIYNSGDVLEQAG